jgi:hypothetical protein
MKRIVNSLAKDNEDLNNAMRVTRGTGHAAQESPSNVTPLHAF